MARVGQSLFGSRWWRASRAAREHKGSQDIAAYEKTNNFEVIVGHSMPEDRALRYLGLVHG
jgi:hypothetical protein